MKLNTNMHHHVELMHMQVYHNIGINLRVHQRKMVIHIYIHELIYSTKLLIITKSQ